MKSNDPSLRGGEKIWNWDLGPHFRASEALKTDDSHRQIHLGEKKNQEKETIKPRSPHTHTPTPTQNRGKKRLAPSSGTGAAAAGAAAAGMVPAGSVAVGTEVAARGAADWEGVGGGGVSWERGQGDICMRGLWK